MSLTINIAKNVETYLLDGILRQYQEAGHYGLVLIMSQETAEKMKLLKDKDYGCDGRLKPGRHYMYYDNRVYLDNDRPFGEVELR